MKKLFFQHQRCRWVDLEPKDLCWCSFRGPWLTWRRRSSSSLLPPMVVKNLQFATQSPAEQMPHTQPVCETKDKDRKQPETERSWLGPCRQPSLQSSHNWRVQRHEGSCPEDKKSSVLRLENYPTTPTATPYEDRLKNYLIKGLLPHVRKATMTTYMLPDWACPREVSHHAQLTFNCQLAAAHEGSKDRGGTTTTTPHPIAVHWRTLINKLRGRGRGRVLGRRDGSFLCGATDHCVRDCPWNTGLGLRQTEHGRGNTDHMTHNYGQALARQSYPVKSLQEHGYNSSTERGYTNFSKVS